MTQNNYDGVVTHLKPDILQCEVKWTLGSITANKAGGGDGIPVELFHILKDGCCKSTTLGMPANSEKSAVATTRKAQFSFHSQRKAIFKLNVQNVQATTQLHSSQVLAKYCSKFSKLSFYTV